jgi:hypothetical protein
MYPLGHLGTGLLVASLFYLPVAAFILGVFLPDIFDKTLSILGLIECSRSYAHNIFFAIGAGAVAFAITRKKNIALAIMLGAMLHLVQDSIHFVPYFYPLVSYEELNNCGPIEFQPGTPEIIFEVVGIALIIIWWKFRSKIFYIREKILKMRRLKRVFG